MKFSREQLNMIVQTIIDAGFDVIEGMTPQSDNSAEIMDFKNNMEEFNTVSHPAINQIGHGLSIFYARVTDDGMETQLPIDFLDLHKVIGEWFNNRSFKQWKRVAGKRLTPETSPLAEKFVNRWFDDYLKPPPEREKVNPEPEERKDVHTEHCCKECGCKYGDDYCPVATGSKRQSYAHNEGAFCGENYSSYAD